MTQIYKVFKETKPLILHNIPFYLANLNNFIYIKSESKEDFNTLLESFWEFEGIEGISLYCPNLESVIGKFRSNFKFVKAAGGMVCDPQERILVIKRNGYLDLPKGHFKKGESPQQAAIREVAEECGISSHVITSDNPQKTYHMFEQNGARILKETQWFKMRVTKLETLVPQADEGIEEAFWMSKQEVEQKINSFYPSLFDLLEGESQ